MEPQPPPPDEPEVIELGAMRQAGFTVNYESYVLERAKGPASESQRVAAKAVSDFVSAFAGALTHFREQPHPLRRHRSVLSTNEASDAPLDFYELVYPPLSPESLDITPGYGPDRVALHFGPTPLLLRRIVWRQFLASRAMTSDAGPHDAGSMARWEQEWVKSYEALMPRYAELVAAGEDPAVLTEGGNILARIGGELSNVWLLALYRRYQANPELFATVASAPLPKPPSADDDLYIELSHGIGFLAQMKIVFPLFSGQPIPVDYLDILSRPDVAMIKPGLDVLAMLPDDQWSAHHEAIFDRLAAWTADELAQNEFIDHAALAALRSAATRSSSSARSTD